ncbi:MAG: PQQ-dependent sugar dehydrogenase [Acidobacteria bacterium]|nr:PQQ-dependent sugar dehydrogenase [Acidobacteriota bacterium]
MPVLKSLCRGLALVVLALPAAAQPSGRAFRPEDPLPGDKLFRMRVVATGLESPWEITWGPDGYLWVTERGARRITRVHPQTGARKAAITIAESAAPGGQEGVLGMALHPDLLQNKRSDFVFVAYTYSESRLPPSPFVPDPASPYRHLYLKVARLSYDPATQTLKDPVTILAGLPAGNDHNSGRLKFGPGRKLYLTIGDQGHNQFGNNCYEIDSQHLPTQSDIQSHNYAHYSGKTLRINFDGSIPADNPRLNGVVSHVYTYGHRNVQGIDFAPDGTYFAAEHGPKSDDEINILMSGGNYGWPRVAGFRDDSGYSYMPWGESKTSCRELQFSDYDVPASVPRYPESLFAEPIIEPLATLFTVPDSHDFRRGSCGDAYFLCWPTIAPGSVEYYAAGGKGIPGWDHVLLVPGMKRGSLYVLPLTADGQRAAGAVYRYFHSANRYRDTAVSPDRRTIYIATDSSGMTVAPDGTVRSALDNPGAILAFTYEKESTPAEAAAALRTAAASEKQSETSVRPANLDPPQFTAAQAAVGQAAYKTSCAVCHGTTLTNGTFGPPLAGAGFQVKWSARTLLDLHRKVQAMPPSAHNSLPAATYSAITAFLLQSNGAQPGGSPLPEGASALRKMSIR